MLRPFIVIGFLSATTGASAEPVLLANDELKATVSGSTVEIDTPLGTTVPMRFGRDGLVAAEAGVLAPVLGAAKDRGRWWVDGDKLCTKWFRWFDAGVRCLVIKKDGTRIFWRKIDDGETGTGTLVADPKQKKQVPPVVAATDPTPQVSEPVSEPASIDKARPDIATSIEKRATRLAGPPRETPAEDRVADAEPATAAASTVPAPPAASAPPTVVASIEPQPGSEAALDDGPTMRFGGKGLMEASSFPVVGIAAPESGSLQQAPADNSEAQAAPAVKELPAKDDRKNSVASGVPSKKPDAVQRQASLEARAVSKSPSQKRALAGRNGREVSAATSSSRSIALYRVTGVAGYDVLNVRRGPSEEHVSVASIPPTGRRVEITGECREAWCPIRYGGITGWVNSYYLAEEGSRQDVSDRASVTRR